MAEFSASDTLATRRRAPSRCSPGSPVGLAAGLGLMAVTGFRVIYVLIAVLIAVLCAVAAVWTRGGRVRRFTAHEAPARPAAGQME
ncbi:hypothetical protein [Lentzea guizhouensis]|uniref:hypothetical protein n=1 Tax=Lentzea guizhouensis TaxID=1586287 RepID=UPI0012B6A57E|nr:hypothetical protein [Lentzea guizhouensis]